MNRLNKTESAVFLYCRFSLFLKDPFSRLFTVLLRLSWYPTEGTSWHVCTVKIEISGSAQSDLSFSKH